jgi:hypothetical protein
MRRGAHSPGDARDEHLQRTPRRSNRPRIPVRVVADAIELSLPKQAIIMVECDIT